MKIPPPCPKAMRTGQKTSFCIPLSSFHVFHILECDVKQNTINQSINQSTNQSFYTFFTGISVVRTLCTCLVMAGLFLTIEPQIFGINSDDDSNTVNESTSARILWPLCFALGFLPVGLMNVTCEKELKKGEVCII